MTPLYQTARALYRGVTTLAGPAVVCFLKRRRARGKEDPARFTERFGVASAARPQGRLVWLHAASVGEAFSVLRMLDRLAADHPDLNTLITTGTVTSAQLLAGRLPPRAIHQYVPVDRLTWVTRFLDHWRPDAALWVESEIWPNLIGETTARGVPLILVNARLSPKSFAGWKRWPSVATGLFGCFTRCLAQDDAVADRLRALGAKDVRITGNLKYAAEPLPADETALAELRGAIGARPCWIAASTHDGEETIAADVHAALKPSHPALMTIVAPRHPARADAIAAMLRARGLRIAQRSRHEAIAPDTDVYLADTLGELGLLYRAAPVVFIGGTITPRGGQNMLEPARLGCVVIAGPSVENFQSIAEDMDARDAWLRAHDAPSLAQAIARLLDDVESRVRLSDSARAFATTQDDVLERVLTEVAPFVATPQEPHRARA